MKIYFAWVENSEDFNPALHNREDEDVFSLNITQKEGGVAVAKVTIQNPKSGLLTAIRKQHCYISYENEEKTHLLFKGSLIGMPGKIMDELIELYFTAQSNDYHAQLEKLSDSLKTRPFWDSLFVEEHSLKDPAEALEARSALYYFCRKTGRLSLSDIFQGKSCLNLGDEFFRDSLKIEVGQEPFCAVDVTLSAQWKQQVEGCHDLSPVIASKFPQGLVSTLTGKDLSQRWWKTGERVGRSSYWIEESELKEVNPPSTGRLNLYPRYSIALWHKDKTTSGLLHEHAERNQVRFKRYWFKPHLKVGWIYRQKRHEQLHFTLHHAVQNLVQNNHRRLRLKFCLQNIVGDNHPWRPSHKYTQGFQVIYRDDLYICLITHISQETFNPVFWQRKGQSCSVQGQSSRPSFFLTDRGIEAFEHALEIARAHLAASARAVTIKLRGEFSKLYEITTDHTLSIRDDRLPGHQVSGKVIAYRIFADGKTGQRFVEVTLGVSIGTPTKKEEATPHDLPVNDNWAESGFCVEDYQMIARQSRTTHSGITYNGWQDQPPQTGVLYPGSLTSFDIVENISIENDADSQNKYLFVHQYPKRSGLEETLREVPTAIKLHLKDLSGFETLRHEIFVKIPESWSAPQQIDLSSQ